MSGAKQYDRTALRDGCKHLRTNCFQPKNLERNKNGIANN